MYEQRIQKLKVVLKDAIPEVRSAAAQAIDQLQAKASIDRFQQILQADDNAAKLRAVYALSELDGD